MALDIRDSDGTTRLHGDIASAAGATGDVLTKQADGTYAPAPPGASATAFAEYTGDPVNVPNAAVRTLTWDTLAAGAALLDLTVPAAPVIVAAGVYAVTVTVSPVAMTEGGAYKATLSVAGATGASVKATTACLHVVDVDQFTSLTITYPVAAGGGFTVDVDNEDGVAARDFFVVNAYLQKL